MYCDNCGAELSNGARVCNACGAAVKAGGSIDNTDDLIAAHAAATRGAARAKANDASLPPNDPYIAFYASQRARERRHFVALIIGICVLLMSAVAFALPAITGTSGVRPGRIAGERRMDDGLEKVGVALPVQAARLDENGSRIPIRVSGHLPQGASYNDAVYVTHEGVSVDLPVGTFEVWVSQTPIASDGTMYRLPENRLQVEVSENFDVTFPGETTTLELKELSGSEISDELIESARSWISKDPERSDRADELAQKAKERRDAQVAKERENAPSTVVSTTTQQDQQKTDNSQQQSGDNNQQGDNDSKGDGDNNDKPSDGGDNDKPSDGDNDKPSDGGDNDKPSDGDNDKPSSDGDKPSSGGDTPADPTPTVDPTPSDGGGSSGGDTPVTPSEPVTPAEPTTPTTPDTGTTGQDVQAETTEPAQTETTVATEVSTANVEA